VGLLPLAHTRHRALPARVGLLHRCLLGSHGPSLAPAVGRFEPG
jgi:hypothetical protein